MKRLAHTQPKRTISPWLKLLSIWLLVSLACQVQLPGGPTPTAQVKSIPTATPGTVPPTQAPVVVADLPPVLVETWPPAGSQIGLNEGVTFYFSQPMDRASVEAALAVRPAVTGSLEWQDDSTFTFQPSQALPTSSELAFEVNIQARSQKNLSLASPVSVPYITASFLEVTQFLPAQDAGPVSPASAITVTFNQPVVALGDEASAPPAFTLSPGVQGRGEWLNTSTFVFYPEPALRGGEDYTASLNTGLTGVSGAPLSPEAAAGQSWSFSTRLPEFVSLSPVPDELLPLDTEFEVTFTQPMDTASVEANLELLDEDDQPVPLTFNWDDANTSVTIIPRRLERVSQYRLAVTQAAQDISGTPLNRTFSVIYHTVGTLAVEGTSSPTGSMLETYSGFGSFNILFNAPLAPGQPLSSFITTEPEVDDLTVSLSYDRRYLYLSGYFQPDTNYTFSIDPKLEDTWGGTLVQPETISVRTAPAEPMLAIYALQSGSPSVFVLPNDATLAVQAANVNNVLLGGDPVDIARFIEIATLDWNDRPIPVGQNFSQHRLDLEPNQAETVSIPLAAGSESLEPGLYYYGISSPDLPDNSGYNRSFLVIASQTNLVLKRSAGELVVWAVDLQTNQPVARQSVTAYDSQGRQVGDGVTDNNGLARVALPQIDPKDPVFAAIGQPGDPNFAFAADNYRSGIAGWEFGYANQVNPDPLFSYTYTDRPIYRPGQIVYLRVVARRGENGRYTDPGLDQVTVHILGEFDPLTGSRPEIETLRMPLSTFGTATGSLELPPGTPPGIYTIEIEEIESGRASFQVAEYRKPEIDLQVEINQEQYTAGSGFQASVTAEYYFGAPAAGQPVYWSLLSEQDYFYMPGYQTGKESTSWLSGRYFNMFSGQTFIEEGSVMTGPNGEVSIRVNWDQLAARIDPEASQRFILTVTLQPEEEDSVSASASARYHPANFYVGVRKEAWNTPAGEAAAFTVQTSRIDLRPSGDQPVSARFEKMSWPEDADASASPAGHEPRFTLVGSTDFRTDGQGRARIAFTPPDPGTYRLTLSGNGAVTQVLVWVSGAGSASWPSLREQRINLVADSTTYTPGQSASILIPNPLGAGTLALVSVERGEVMRTQVLELDESSRLLSLPLSEEDAPNVYVSVTLIGRRTEGRPDFRQGFLQLQVDPSSLRLNVDLQPESAQSYPGGSVDMRLRVTDAQGEPVQGEFSLALVDKAVFALAEPNALPIFEAFYGLQPLGVLTGLDLAAYSWRVIPPLLGGGGGGGEGPASSTVREEFKDTAFWNGAVVTDINGEATVRVTLPDNLTTWVALVRGLSQDSRVGEASGEIVATKPLLVRPQTPRFLIAGDRVELAAIVHNNTRDPLAVNVGLLALGAELEQPEAANQVIDLEPGQSQRVSWWATVNLTDIVDLTFTAMAGDLQDAAKPELGSIPVLKYAAPVTQASGGVLSEEGSRQEVIALPRSYDPLGGDLTVELSPSLAAALLNGLAALEEENFPTSETLVSRFLPLMETYRTLQDAGQAGPELRANLERNMDASVRQLVEMQNEDGGWGWAAGSSSSPYISAYVAFGLNRAYQNGAPVPMQVLEDARLYLLENRPVLSAEIEPWELDRLVFQSFVLSQMNAGEQDFAGLYDRRQELSPWAKAFLAMALSAQNPGDQGARTLLSDLELAAIRSSTGLHWESAGQAQNLSSPVFTTAVIVYALAQLDPASSLLTDAVRYLAANRQASFGWASSYETAWTVLAFNAAFKGTGDLLANFEFSAALNGIKIAEGAANPSSSTPVTAAVTLNELNPGGSVLNISRTAGTGRLYYRTFLNLYAPAESARAVQRGITIQRTYFQPGENCPSAGCPLAGPASRQADQPIYVRLVISSSQALDNLVVEDFIPAGAEIIDPSLGTNRAEGGLFDPDTTLEYGWGWWFFGEPQVTDSGVRWLAQQLPAGTYELVYRIQPRFAGEFRVLPAHAYELYFPDIEGTTAGEIFEIE